MGGKTRGAGLAVGSPSTGPGRQRAGMLEGAACVHQEQGLSHGGTACGSGRPPLC